jgi:hypothetical protein
VLLWCTALGYVVQMQAAKLGVVTGRHLAQHCRDAYAPAPRYALWVMAEIAIIGSGEREREGERRGGGEEQWVASATSGWGARQLRAHALTQKTPTENNEKNQKTCKR